MISTQLTTQFLSILTIVGNIFIIGFVALFIYHKVRKKKLNFGFLEDNALILAFVVSLLATLGSLFYSEIAGYTPCKLCWYQRIFMYPQVIILGTALIRKARNIVYYVIPLSVIGGGISIYHYFIQRAAYAASCSANGVSCSSKYVFHFGYITIPIMALTAFGLIIILTYLRKNPKTKDEK